MNNKGYIYAILAAVLFGASTPFSKALMQSMSPWMLAGVLYFGSGLGLLLVFMVRSKMKAGRNLTSIPRHERRALAGAVFWGGAVGPVLLMYGLARVNASSAALLLNFEAVLTAGVAWLFFKEHFDRRIALGMFSIVLGGMALSWSGSFDLESLLGPLLIFGACLSWAIDNNLTRKVSASDPVQIALIKSLVAGGANVLLAKFSGAVLPPLNIALWASLLGFASYGLSLVFFVLGLRHLGTARTGAYFSTAPFVGALLSIVFFHEAISLQLALGAVFMGFGVYLHLSESHEHEHAHQTMQHSHRHTHDEHHQHTHTAAELSNLNSSEFHTHLHTHTPLTHAHVHYPDIHHRHEHLKTS